MVSVVLPSVFIGIDLGTTNSALAVFDGDRVTILPNALGENLTPSVVHLDDAGALEVGRAARRFLEQEPARTRAEWKRLMGTAQRLPIGERALLPEELSARVLEGLLGDARDALGFAPRAAVISVPALFELPQNHATVRAGKLAGLEEVVLIQEPIASAIAAEHGLERRLRALRPARVAGGLGGPGHVRVGGRPRGLSRGSVHGAREPRERPRRPPRRRQLIRRVRGAGAVPYRFDGGYDRNRPRLRQNDMNSLAWPGRAIRP
jgi:hypothetical protein